MNKMSMSAQQQKKVDRLLEQNKVRKVSDGVYEVEGSGGVYTVELHASGRVKSCSCPAGSIWGRGRLRKAGAHVCYHVGAVAQGRKQHKLG